LLVRRVDVLSLQGIFAPEPEILPAYTERTQTAPDLGPPVIGLPIIGLPIIGLPIIGLPIIDQPVIGHWSLTCQSSALSSSRTADD
jgi:hypothetical protein